MSVSYLRTVATVTFIGYPQHVPQLVNIFQKLESISRPCFFKCQFSLSFTMNDQRFEGD